MISLDIKQLTELAEAHIKAARIVLIPMGLSLNW